jgi:hypothetical protein
LGFEVLTVVVMKSPILWDITPCSTFESTDVSEEHVTSIFGVEEEDKQETSPKQVASRP